MNTPWQVLAAGGVDPSPITAWLLLVVALLTIIGGVCAFIAFTWKFVALPQITALIEGRIDLLEKSTSAAFRHVHRRFDTHLTDHP